jgi:hypothetical protein
MRAAPTTTAAFSFGANITLPGTVSTYTTGIYCFIGAAGAGGAATNLNLGTNSAEL